MSSRAGSSWNRRHIAALCGGAVVMAVLVFSLVCLGAWSAGVRGVFAIPLLGTSVPPAGIRPPSALLQIPSAARCTRLHLPAALANTSQVPSFPAAVRDPGSGEWLLFFSYQEVCAHSGMLQKLFNASSRLLPAPKATCE